MDERSVDLERFRGYLTMLARLQVGSRLQGKLGASDVVQQTLVQAVAGMKDFRGRSDAETAAWLRQILARQLANVARDLGRQKRDIARERSLEAALDKSACRLEQFLATHDSSPSQRAQRNEQLWALADALSDLPEAQREAVVLHHLEGWRLEQIAQHLERSPAAVGGLLKRGLRTLRQRLQISGSDAS